MGSMTHTLASVLVAYVNTFLFLVVVADLDLLTRNQLNTHTLETTFEHSQTLGLR